MTKTALKVINYKDIKNHVGKKGVISASNIP